MSSKTFVSIAQIISRPPELLNDIFHILSGKMGQRAYMPAEGLARCLSLPDESPSSRVYFIMQIMSKIPF
jgi:hypothetical protein